MKDDAATKREKALAATFLAVNQQQINPWLISADLAAPSVSLNIVELRIGLAILVFEMRQCDVQVDEQSILDFVKEDIKKHKCTALDGYLMVARAIISPRPTRKSDGWFARVFTSPPKWVPPVPRWKWKSVTSVEVINDEVLVIKGGCVESS